MSEIKYKSKDIIILKDWVAIRNSLYSMIDLHWHIGFYYWDCMYYDIGDLK